MDTTSKDRKSIIYFYMDDLKLYGKNDHEHDELLKRVKTFSNDIGMTFGPDMEVYNVPWSRQMC